MRIDTKDIWVLALLLAPIPIVAFCPTPIVVNVANLAGETQCLWVSLPDARSETSCLAPGSSSRYVLLTKWRSETYVTVGDQFGAFASDCYVDRLPRTCSIEVESASVVRARRKMRHANE